MSDQYTSNRDRGDFPGTLVDNSFDKRLAATRSNQPPNYPPPGDTTSEGGYGGNPYTKSHQAPVSAGHFKKGVQSDSIYPQDGPIHPGGQTEEEFERHAGEGVIPPNEAAAGQATSSGVGEDAMLNQYTSNATSDNVGA